MKVVTVLMVVLIGSDPIAALWQASDNCEMCMDFSFNYSFLIQHLLSVPGNATNCEQLSQQLQSRTNSQQVYRDCQTLCDTVGLRNFSVSNIKSHKNPLLFCKMIGECSDGEEGDAKILSIEFDPPVVPHGSKFKIIVTFQTHNGTNDGITTLSIFNNESPYPVLASTTLKAKPPGIYKVIWEYTASLDPNCPEKCEYWPSGTYNTEIGICSGYCHSCPQCKVYDYKNASFRVVSA